MELVHIAMENFFGGNDTLQYLGEGGRKATITCRRDRLSKSVPKRCLNFIKAAPVNHRSKVARFEQPTIAIENVKHPEKNSPNDNVNKPQTARASKKNNNDVLLEKNDYVLCHVSFHSTGVMNISSVNAFSSVELYAWERKKGRGI
jgi:hypothetical protein